MEATLEKMIAEIEEKTQKPFTYDGYPLLEKIAELWEQRRQEKENEKEVRVSQKIYYRMTNAFVILNSFLFCRKLKVALLLR